MTHIMGAGESPTDVSEPKQQLCVKSVLVQSKATKHTNIIKIDFILDLKI